MLGGGGPRVCEIAKAGIRGNFEARGTTIGIGISVRYSTDFTDQENDGPFSSGP